MCRSKPSKILTRTLNYQHIAALWHASLSGPHYFQIFYCVDRQFKTDATQQFRPKHTKYKDRLITGKWSPCHKCWHTIIHRESKKGDTILLSISLLNIDRFSQFFHRRTQLEICNKIINKDPTSPQMCCYTTLWNVNVRKSSGNWKVQLQEFFWMKFF